jgi:hypothetical protein
VNAIRTAFLDLLFNTLLVFVVLFVMAFLHMRPPTQDKAVEPKAELVLEMNWPEGSLDDLDLWLLTPSGEKIGFNRQDGSIATLDRDDRGAYGDTYFVGTERKLNRTNREVMAVRSIVPGRYVVNVHYYSDFTAESVGFEEPHSGPITARVKLIDVNPRMRDVGANDVTLFAVGQQVTAFAFEVDADGAVTALDKAADLPFVEVRK